MKTISLTQGQYAIVDDEDFDFINQWKWHAFEERHKRTPSMWYAARDSQRPIRRSIYMHREIGRLCDFQKTTNCDHKDANGLNNQRANLRPCSQTQNQGNRVKELGRTSIFKGVYWDKSRNEWRSEIGYQYKRIHLGRFENEEAAARAYDTAARIQFGQFARLNFP